jgi:hypothetical protein
MAEKRIMDEATKEKLHGLLPFSTKATINYTPEFYKEAEVPEEFRPVFVLRPYARDEVKNARKVLTSVEKDEVQKEDNFIELSRKVVVGWNNLYDVGNGEEIEYVQDSTGGACKEIYDNIPTPVKAAILIQAVKISGLFDLAKLGLKF